MLIGGMMNNLGYEEPLLRNMLFRLSENQSVRRKSLRLQHTLSLDTSRSRSVSTFPGLHEEISLLE